MDGEWISITEAAQRLTASGDHVDRSTLSRYLKQHSEALPIRAEGKSNLVEFDALVAHRKENIRIRSMPSEVRPSDGRHAPPPRFKGSQSDGAARKAQADAEMRELDLGERRKQLTPVVEVDRAGRDAIALMMSAFDRAIETEAASLSLKYGWDERTVRIALKGYARKGVEVFHREILERLDAMRRSDEAGEPTGQPVEATQLQ
jgi:hypothetical protein